MRRRILAGLALVLAMGLFNGSALRAADESKQPVFLMCPHKAKFSAWSLYVVTDKADPSKIATLGLEKLNGANSIDMDGFKAVLAVQKDPNARRETLGTLDAKDFGTGKIKVEKDDALHVSLAPAEGGDYRLMISMRCTSDKRFNIGGKEQKTRDVVLKFNKEKKAWEAHALKLSDSEGNVLTQGGPLHFVGINFPVTGTGIYRIVGLFGSGEVAVLIDGWERRE